MPTALNLAGNLLSARFTAHDPLPTLEAVVRVGFLSAERLGRPLLGAVGADAGRAAWGLSDAGVTVTEMSS